MTTSMNVHFYVIGYQRHLYVLGSIFIMFRVNSGIAGRTGWLLVDHIAWYDNKTIMSNRGATQASWSKIDILLI